MKKIYTILLLIPIFLNAQIYVDKDATGANNGTSWSDAYTDLQAALENATLGEQVWVAAGTYLPSTNGNIDTSFVLKQSIELYGGFDGTASITADNYAPFTYEWNHATIQGGNPMNLNANSYEVKVINSIGDFEMHNFTVNEYPEIMSTTSFTYATTNNNDGEASVNVSGGFSPFIYEWNTAPIQNTATATNLSEGMYSVVITDSLGCQKIDTINLFEPNGIISIEYNNEIKIGPNPMEETLDISLTGSVKESMIFNKISVYNITGQIMYNNSFDNSATTTLNVSNMPKGIYIIELSGNENIYRKRLVKN